MTQDFIFYEYTQLINGIFRYQDQQIELRILNLKILLGTFAIIGILAFSNLGLSNAWPIFITCSS